MIVKNKPLVSRQQSVKEIVRLANIYNNDIIPFNMLNYVQFFDLLKNIKYKRDTSPIEVVSRPLMSLRRRKADCKKKTIIAIAYAIKNNIPYRIITMSSIPNMRIHHVFPQLFINGKWLNYDATYPQFKLGEKKFVTNFEIYNKEGKMI